MTGVCQCHGNMLVRLSKFFQVLLSVLCTLIVLSASQDHYLGYNSTTGLLHFWCPLDRDLTNNHLIVATLGRYNQGTTSRQVYIASWYDNESTIYENTGKVVINTRQYGLAGYLTDVPCEDLQTYFCDFHLQMKNRAISQRLENFPSIPEGLQ